MFLNVVFLNQIDFMYHVELPITSLFMVLITDT